MTNFLLKKQHIFPSAPDSKGSAEVRWAVLRDPQSTRAGLFTPQPFVSTSASGRQCHVSVPEESVKTHCQCKSQTGSPEPGAGCGSPECHVPYIIQNQYLTSCSPYTLWHSSVFFFKQKERLQFESVRGARAVPTAALLLPLCFLFSSSILRFLLLFWSKFSCLVPTDPLGLEWFSAECGIKIINF